MIRIMTKDESNRIEAEIGRLKLRIRVLRAERRVAVLKERLSAGNQSHSKGFQAKRKSCRTGRGGAAVFTIGVPGTLIALFESLVYAIPWNWLQNHVNSYGLQVAVAVLVVSAITWRLQPQWRKSFWSKPLLRGLVFAIIMMLGRQGSFPAVQGPERDRQDFGPRQSLRDGPRRSEPMRGEHRRARVAPNGTRTPSRPRAGTFP
jgi:hypothetical protein